MMREKSRLPPSPQSRHAKKPLISLETARTYSLDRMKKQEKPMNNFQSLGKAYAHSSSKQNENPNLFCLNANNNIQDKKKEESLRCINHSQRKALAMSCKNPPEYYCFECSLYQARRGIKIIQIKSQSEQQSQPSTPINPRTKTLQHYIHQSTNLQKTLTSLISSLKSLLTTYTHKFSQLIEQQQHEMQTLIKAIQQQTHAKIKQIQIKSAQQNKIIMKRCQQIMCVKSVLQLNRLDVIKNYQDCVHGFGEAQFRQVMGSYWRQIDDFGREFGEAVVERVGVSCEVGYQEMVNFVGIRNWKDFTFSKQQSYQSPKSYQKLEGVPIISSNYYTGKSAEHNQTVQTYHIQENKGIHFQKLK